MNPLSDRQLGAIAARTFENLAFMFVLTEGEAARAAAPADIAASVQFEGPLCGQLVVTIDRGMLPVLAANMLGLEPLAAPTATDQCDALKELANVLCGNILPELAGTEAVFTVRPPVLIDGDDDDGGAGGPEAPAASATLALDAGTARLALHVVSDVPAATSTARQADGSN
jgi:CheY-specific phosphatase CheX